MDFIGIILTAAFTLGLLFLGFFAGSVAEKRHLQRLDDREAAHADMVKTQSRMFLSPVPGAKPPQLLVSEMVVASDYFKNFLAYFRKIFGGEMRSYHSLMVRARREALMRLVEQARAHGYNAICNVRLEPADVGGSLSKKGSAMVCIIASATGYNTSLIQPVPPNKPPVATPPVKPPVMPPIKT